MRDAFTSWFAATERTVTLYLAGRQPVRPPAPTRSTRSSTAISRPAASAGPAWDRSRSPASRTPWAGARSAASPTSLPRTCASTTPPISTACAASGTRRALRPRPGLKAVDLFDAVARRPHQGDLDHGHQSGRQHAARRARARGAGSLPFRRRQRLLGRPTRRRSPMSCCRPPAGARRTARSPIPSAASRASAPSAPPPGEARARLVDHRRSGAAHGLGTTLSPTTSRPQIFREHAALSAFENDGARAFDLGALAGAERRRIRAARAVQWPAARGRRGAGAAASSRDGIFPTPDRRARFVADALESAGSRRRAGAIPSCSTPAASAISGTR